MGGAAQTREYWPRFYTDPRSGAAAALVFALDGQDGDVRPPRARHTGWESADQPHAKATGLVQTSGNLQGSNRGL